MKRQILKMGNSYGLTLPPEEVERLHLKPGDEVEIYSDGNALKIVPMTRIKAVSLEGLWKNIKISEEDISIARREAWKDLYR